MNEESNTLRAHRIDAGMTQGTAALLAGVSRTRLSLHERGVKELTQEEVVNVIAILTDATQKADEKVPGKISNAIAVAVEDRAFEFTAMNTCTVHVVDAQERYWLVAEEIGYLLGYRGRGQGFLYECVKESGWNLEAGRDYILVSKIDGLDDLQRYKGHILLLSATGMSIAMTSSGRQTGSFVRYLIDNDVLTEPARVGAAPEPAPVEIVRVEPASIEDREMDIKLGMLAETRRANDIAERRLALDERTFLGDAYYRSSEMATLIAKELRTDRVRTQKKVTALLTEMFGPHAGRTDIPGQVLVYSESTARGRSTNYKYSPDVLLRIKSEVEKMPLPSLRSFSGHLVR